MQIEAWLYENEDDALADRNGRAQTFEVDRSYPRVLKVMELPNSHLHDALDVRTDTSTFMVNVLLYERREIWERFTAGYGDMLYRGPWAEPTRFAYVHLTPAPSACSPRTAPAAHPRRGPVAPG